MRARRQNKRKPSATGRKDAGFTTFHLFAAEQGDPSVGIPHASGPVVVTVPDWLVGDGQAGEFERGLATLLSGWVPDGVVMTSWEKAEEDALCESA